MSLSVSEKRLDNGQVLVTNSNGLPLYVVKTKYIESTWGISYASTHVASCNNEDDAIRVARAVAGVVSDRNIANMRKAATAAISLI